MKKITKFLAAFIVSVFILFSCQMTPADSAASDQIDTTEAIVENNDQSDSLVQCIAITKKGTQCERLVAYPDSLCFQHKTTYNTNE